MPSQLTTYQILTVVLSLFTFGRAKWIRANYALDMNTYFLITFSSSLSLVFFCLSHHAITLEMVFNRKRNLFFNRNACIGQISLEPFQIYTEFRIKSNVFRFLPFVQSNLVEIRLIEAYFDLLRRNVFDWIA